jgi:hypothetical protein
MRIPVITAKRAALAAGGGLASALLVATCSLSLATQSPDESLPTPTVQLAPHGGTAVRTAELTTVATFPSGTFLENLALRKDGGILTTAILQKELWYVPAPTEGGSTRPVLLHTFDELTTAIVETRPDVFIVITSNAYTDHAATLQLVDLRGWSPGKPVPIEQVWKFTNVDFLNGSTMLGRDALLITDSGLGIIWRVDLSHDGAPMGVSAWLDDPSMKIDPNVHLRGLPQPGINGVHYDSRTHYVYYTSTSKRLFMRVAVDRHTLAPSGRPEVVAGGMMGDDFTIDENANVAYITTHRQNTIERVPLDPNSGEPPLAVAGEPFDPQVAGPSSIAWARGPHDFGSVAYVSTDGGLVAPPPSGVGPARIVRADFN